MRVVIRIIVKLDQVLPKNSLGPGRAKGGGISLEGRKEKVLPDAIFRNIRAVEVFS